MFVIAEIGVNHQGRLATAMDLIDAAKDAGADAAKFQFFSSEKLWGDNRIKHLEMRFADLEKLCLHCERTGIEFMCTPFGIEELLLLTPMLKRVKIASGCLVRKPLLEAARDTRLPIILSTGMSTLDEIEQALALVQPNPLPMPYCKNVTLLHCTSSYPCLLEDVNLKVLDLFRWRWGRHEQHSNRTAMCDIGLSDHTTGITVPIAAAALGAQVIEKHLTLNRDMIGPDHKTSITPREFKAMRIAIGEVEAALGDGVKRVMECEVPLRVAWHGN